MSAVTIDLWCYPAESMAKHIATSRKRYGRRDEDESRIAVKFNLGGASVGGPRVEIGTMHGDAENLARALERIAEAVRFAARTELPPRKALAPKKLSRPRGNLSAVPS